MNAKEYNNAVELYADNIYRFALKHIKNGALAQDVVQETFMKVWLKHEDIVQEKIKSYLFTTAYHTIIDSVKKEKRSVDFDLVDKSVMSDAFADAESNNNELRLLLDQALNQLPEIQKSAVLLRDYEGYSYEEIAEITSLTESQVKVYIFRARQSLKTHLKEHNLVV